MKRLLTIAASLALLATPLAAQARGGGGFHGGGGHAAAYHGGGFHGGGYRGGYRGYRGGYGGYGGWGYGAAGFGLGVLAGSALAAPYYDDYYDYPGYAQPAYGYAPAPQQCGQWVWNPQANQYVWAAGACQ